jgi:hypothetical protein
MTWIGQVVRVLRLAGGALLILAGLAMVILPGPGIPVLLAGLVVLERDFHVARTLRVRLTALCSSALTVLSRAARWLWGRAAYSLSLLPVLTDWVDSGHWPEHPRELATEVALGALIVIGVALLYRRGDRFRTLAETDALTGLGNRFRFRGDIEAEVARAIGLHGDGSQHGTPRRRNTLPEHAQGPARPASVLQPLQPSPTHSDSTPPEKFSIVLRRGDS